MIPIYLDSSWPELKTHTQWNGTTLEIGCFCCPTTHFFKTTIGFLDGGNRDGAWIWHLLSCIMHCISTRFFPLLLVVVELYHSWKKQIKHWAKRNLKPFPVYFIPITEKKSLALCFSHISNICWIRIRSTKKRWKVHLLTAIHCKYSVLLRWRCLLRWMVEILHQLGW